MPKEFIIKTTHDYSLILHPYINGTLYQYIVKNLDFKPFKVTIDEYKETRTSRQNSLYWANVGSIVDILNKNGCYIVKMGIMCEWEKEDVHSVNKKEFGVGSTKKLSTKEFCDLMESVFAFWIEKTKGKWQPLDTMENYYKQLEEGNE